MNKLKKYQKLIATVVVILLLLEFGIYPCLTMANTLANIVGAIALLVVCIWAVLSFGNSLEDDDISNIPPGETELDYVPPPTPKMKAKAKATKSEYPLPPHSKTVKTTKTKKTK